MAALTYYSGIPTASQRLKDSQPQIQTNFTNLQSYLEINHEAFSNDPNYGKHKFVQFPNQSSDPSGSIGASEVGLYCKDDGSAVQQLYLKNGSSSEIAITGATLATTGETTLPSGLKIKWGQSATASNGLATVTFTNAFSTAIYSIQTTVANAAGSSSSGTQDSYTRVYQYSTTSMSIVGFRLNVARDRLVVPFHWYVIGV